MKRMKPVSGGARVLVTAGIVAGLLGCSTLAAGSSPGTARPGAASPSTMAGGATAPPNGWWVTKGTSACGPLGAIWTPQGSHELGSCAGTLVGTPPSYEISVGDEVVVHAYTDLASNTPTFPVPDISDMSVVSQVATSDGGGTTTFRGIHAGTATFTTEALCPNASGDVRRRTCQLLTIVVRP